MLYGSFSAFPIIFSAHGLSTSTIGLCFLPVLVGFLLLFVVTILHYARYKRLALDATKGLERRGIHNNKVEPEERLVPRELSVHIYSGANPSRDSFLRLRSRGEHCPRTAIPSLREGTQANTSDGVLRSLPRWTVLARMDISTQLQHLDPDHERPAIRVRAASDFPREYAVLDRRVRAVRFVCCELPSQTHQKPQTPRGYRDGEIAGSDEARR